jgi:hypothetical protein
MPRKSITCPKYSSSVRSCTLGFFCSVLVLQPDPSRGCTHEISFAEGLAAIVIKSPKVDDKCIETPSEKGGSDKLTQGNNTMCARSLYGPPLNPLIQPGAFMLYTISSSEMSVQGRNLRMEPVPASKPKAHTSSHDATPQAIAFPLLIVLTVFAFRRKLFASA